MVRFVVWVRGNVREGKMSRGKYPTFHYACPAFHCSTKHALRMSL